MNVSCKNLFKRMLYLSLLASFGFIALGFTGPSAALAAGPAPVDLLSAGNFVILAETGITNTGGHASVITGNIGNSPGTAAQMDGVWCSEITGTIYGVDAAYVGSGTTTCFAGNPGVPPVVPPDANKTLVDNAVGDMLTAYNNAAAVVTPAPIVGLGGGSIGGMTLAPGLYKWNTDVNIATNLTLSGGVNDVWIFQIAGDLSIAPGGSIPAGIKVILSNGAQAANVFWQVGGPTGATLGTYSTFNGTILSAKQVILRTGAVLNGRALAQTQVVLDANTVTFAAAPPPPGTPTLSKAFSPAVIDQGGVSTLTIILSNPSTNVAELTTALTDTLPINVVIANPANAGTTCSGTGAVVATPGTSTVTLPETRSIPAGNGTTPGTCTVTVDVTSATEGAHLNTLGPNALQTNRGNNANTALATLTVNPLPVSGEVAPTVGKSFTPALIGAGDTSTLIITLSNSSIDTDDIITTLTDTLPDGMVIAEPSGAGTTCGTGVVTAIPGTDTITLTGGTIPHGNSTTSGTCTVTVNVVIATEGSYINTLRVGDLQTEQGNNAATAVATLIAAPANASPTPVPTLNEWGLIFFMVFAGLGAVYYLRKYRRV